MTGIRQNKFGFIFQRHYLIEYLSLIQNILTPLKKPGNEDKDFADFLMQELGIYKLKDKYPNEVSVGERQKAAVIRAIIHKPDIIFADEPTASMDIDSAMNAMSLLKSYDKTAGLVIVTHDYKILSGTDKIYHMRDGKFI
jgi:putative ABC transport system ATP-binding protein